MTRRVVLAALLAAGAAVGCGTGGSPRPPGAEALVLFAAASLRDGLTDAAAAWEAASGEAMTLVFDSSAALATQIEQGAPADVLAAADLEIPGRLVDAGLAQQPVVPFATNGLVIVVPRANPARIDDPADLARAGTRIVAAGEAVPVTRYADEVVARLAVTPGYPPGYVAAVQANVVSREDNVRAVLAKVALGEADAGFVYATDARSSDAVAVVDVPVHARVVVPYGGVVTTGSRRPDEARSLLDWLAGDGQGILAAHGFGPPPVP